MRAVPFEATSGPQSVVSTELPAGSVSVSHLAGLSGPQTTRQNMLTPEWTLAPAEDVIAPANIWHRMRYEDDGRMPIGKIGGIAALLTGVTFGGLSACIGEGAYSVSNPGVASLKEVRVHPGLYCNAEFVAAVKKISVHINKDISFFPDPWITETMSGDIKAQVCIKLSSIITAKRAETGDDKGKFVLNLRASSDPTKSDFELITYKANPAEMKFNKTEGYVNRLGDFVFSSVNLIPLWDVDPSASTEDKLKGLAEEQGYNLVSRMCADKALDRLQQSTTPGGTMGSQLARDMSGFAQASLKDKNAQIKPTDVAMHIIHDPNDPGIATQYDFDGTLKKVEHDTKGLTFPKAKHMPACGDAIKGTPVKKQQVAGGAPK